MNYCRRDKNLQASTHKNQVQIKKYNSHGRWQPIDNKKDVGIYMENDILVTTDKEKYTDVIQNAADSDDIQNLNLFLELRGKGKRTRQNDIQERKLDKLCCLVEKLIEILFLNIQPLRNHHDQLKVLVASLKWQPCVVALSKTWLNDNDRLELYNLDGYQKDIFVNRQKSRGGGLAFFIKDQIDFSHEILSYELEIVVLTLSLGSKQKLNVCLMYRPPSINSKHFLTQFEGLLVNLNSKQCQNSIIVGDMILDILNVSRNSRLIEEYKLILSFFWILHIK